MGSSTGIVVRWRTDVAVVSKLTYGSSSSQKTQSVSRDVPTTEHEVSINGLTPSSVYYYGIQV
ncbi:MAG TPA: metallophosphoesterase, partial [Runella sp.]|nr:metallophosphoesterase [Runella sp.]